MAQQRIYSMPKRSRPLLAQKKSKCIGCELCVSQRFYSCIFSTADSTHQRTIIMITLVGTEGLANILMSTIGGGGVKLPPVTLLHIIWTAEPILMQFDLFAPELYPSSPISRSATYRHAINMAEKPEARRIQYNTLRMSHISGPPDEMSETFQRLHRSFFQPICEEHNRWDPDIGRLPKYKMTAAKPEVVISHVLPQIDTRLQLICPGFRDYPARRSHRWHPPTSIDTQNARWRPPNRK
jgi:hypothetical protein